jgi:hypothetical protein
MTLFGDQPNMLRQFGHDTGEIAPGVEGDWIQL